MELKKEVHSPEKQQYDEWIVVLDSKLAPCRTPWQHFVGLAKDYMFVPILLGAWIATFLYNFL